MAHVRTGFVLYRHGNDMIYEKAYGHPNNAGKPISMKFGKSVPVTANTNGKSQSKGSGHPGNIDVIEFGKGSDKGNESLSMEIIVNRSGQKGTGTKWDMKYLIEYDPIVEIDRTSADFQLTKINQNGEILWSKSYAGEQKDLLESIVPSVDGGYLLFGTSSSDKSSDKTHNSRGGEDFWLIKVDGAGNIVWDKTYGGNGDDRAVSILSLQGNGYLLSGRSDYSSSSDKSETGSNRKNLDFWVVRVNEMGKVLWDRTFDNGGEDRLSSVLATVDGGFLIAGDTEVIGGTAQSNSKTANKDFWLVKIDASGNQVWEKTLGGEGNEEFPVLKQNELDYLVVGTTNSGISGDLSMESIGGRDQWMVQVDANGEIVSESKMGKAGTSSVSYRSGVEAFGENFLVTSFVDDRKADTLLAKTSGESVLIREKRLAYDFLAPAHSFPRSKKSHSV